MSSDPAPEVSALAINVTIPEALRWTDTRRGEEFTLTTLNIRLLPDGRLAAKAYGQPIRGGRGAYVSFRVPERLELAELIARAASRAGTPVERASRSRLTVDERKCLVSVGRAMKAHRGSAIGRPRVWNGPRAP